VLGGQRTSAPAKPFPHSPHALFRLCAVLRLTQIGITHLQAKKRHKRSWKDVFEYRKRLDDDWRTGAYSRVVTLVGHESQVCCCQYDDEKIISGSFDATVKGASAFVF
jgi:hypothetical protein